MTINDITAYRVEMKVYVKNSFDRFGDDLTELILQYLTFVDKIRLECVSKQWQRLVFNKQIVIELSYNRFFNFKTKNSVKFFLLYGNEKELIQSIEVILKKCQNIISVELNVEEYSSEVLSLIGQYCPRIKSLNFFQSINNDNKSMSFFRMYGHKLQELYLFDTNEKHKQILKLCPNMKKLNIRDTSIVFEGDKEFLPKLEFIGFWNQNINIYSEDVNKMKILSDKYSQTMKTLNIKLCYLTEEELKKSIDCISRFENLKKLKLILLPITEPIDNCLSLIGQKCSELLKLELVVHNSILNSNTFFQIFSEFKHIKKLKITISGNTVVNGSIDSLKYCKQLNELDIEYPELTEGFFTNIASFVPKLQSLRIKTDKQFSHSFIDSFHSMKNIQNVIIFNDYHSKSWYFGKQLCEVMSSSDGKYVFRINDNCGIIY